ncbi:endonuclease/exonuclease/phosphatase family protein [Rhizobium sp. TRM96647]|uniref:endonuclease/exonuclease/phosphatase family protein n=1 Tax=unclassified Rhizobium TaxID=2613769 RepID=UPI0021E8CA8B|nr:MULTISPECIES: endonuclease/exonuclease/phosphatase family protein [unclassified Rhizobium]MCV3734966.1 endonuclease/exonuclease/phosphatase family protein [Rhizobium sp. TRM96647]MCV3757336.1 endonuclease/exonuclease/phosphatase family protein [Rhizobium sp. TRM96650]
MKFASYNIQYGIGLDGRLDLRRIAGEIESADVIALQEVTRGFHRNGHIDMVAELQALLPGHFSAYWPACDIDAGSIVEDGRAFSRRFQFGNMVLSRHPILATRLVSLPRSRTLDKLNLQRGATEAVIDTPGGALRVYSVHLDHVYRGERIEQIRHLKERAQAYALEGGAISGAEEFGLPQPPFPDDYVFMGDFNMVPESPEYCAMVGEADGFYGRQIRATHPVDVLAGLGRQTIGSHSWIDPKDHGHRMLLDYCFVSHGLVGRLKDAWIDETATGSDHLPVWFELL